ncbi:MAG: helix-turn-helix domain-containing protein [Nanoarchaeota archaeon]
MNSKKDEKRFLTIKELSQMLNISIGSLYNMIYMKEIPYYKIGKRVRFNEEEIMNWLEKQKLNEFDYNREKSNN